MREAFLFEDAEQDSQSFYKKEIDKLLAEENPPESARIVSRIDQLEKEGREAANEALPMVVSAVKMGIKDHAGLLRFGGVRLRSRGLRAMYRYVNSKVASSTPRSHSVLSLVHGAWDYLASRMCPTRKGELVTPKQHRNKRGAETTEEPALTDSGLAVL